MDRDPRHDRLPQRGQRHRRHQLEGVRHQRASASGRGDVGYLALNNSADDSKQTFQTSLPAGEYCNVYATGDCSATVTVKDDGTFDATLAKNSAIAIYAGATKRFLDRHDQVRSVRSGPVRQRRDQEGHGRHEPHHLLKLPDGWKQAYPPTVSTDGAEQGHELMADAGNGWVKFTVDPKGKSLEYVFTDGGDNRGRTPNGGGNYPAQGHFGRWPPTTRPAPACPSGRCSRTPAQHQGDQQLPARSKATPSPIAAACTWWGHRQRTAPLNGAWHASPPEDSTARCSGDHPSMVRTAPPRSV